MENAAVPVDQPAKDGGYATPAALLGRLQALSIDFRLYEHEAVFSVSESEKLDAGMPGVHTRNLFVRDKRENMFLVTLKSDTKIDLSKLAALIGAGRLSFGSPDRLMKYLGVTPGSVTPFAIMNDRGHKVTLVLDRDMMGADLVNYHPLINTMTVGLAPSGLLKFLETVNVTPQIIDLSPAHGE